MTDGDTSDANGDHSNADLMLCRLLAFWTRKDAERMDQFFQRSGLYRAKWDKVHFANGQTYGEHTIAKAIEDQEEVWTPGRAGDVLPTFFPYDWQQRAWDERERTRLQRRTSAQVKRDAYEHLTRHAGGLLVITVPPGGGKTHATSELGAELDIAWISERHDKAKEVEQRSLGRHIQKPTQENCPFWREHEALARNEFDMIGWHRGHNCAYSRQFQGEGSAIYMVEHVPTRYPAEHQDGVVVDEFTLSKWLHERKYTSGHLEAALRAVTVTVGSTEEKLLEAVQATIRATAREAGQTRYPDAVTGRSLFDRLDARCGGRLEAWVEELAQNPEYLEPRRKVTPEVEGNPDGQSPNVLPHLVRALYAELPKWLAGGDWNGLLRIAKTQLDSSRRKEWIVGITETRRFSTDDSTWPQVLLDATAHEEFLSRLFRVPVRVVSESEQIVPPPHTRHVHVPIRYGVTTLKSAHRRDLHRAIGQAKFLLGLLNPDGSKKVGLITFKDMAREIGAALSIPVAQQGWYFAERGSNLKEDCDILLLIGTPSLPSDEVARLARALFADDPEPIDPTYEPTTGYRDERMREVDTYLTNAELTQCAHRNRPLWHDGRVVVTLCHGEIADLPITEEYGDLPQLDETGERVDLAREEEREERLERAYQEYVAANGKLPSVGRLKNAAGVGTDAAQDFMRRKRATGDGEAS